MFYNREVFELAANSINKRGGRLPVRKFRDFLPGVIDFMNSRRSATGVVGVTYENKDVMVLVSPPIAEQVMAQRSFNLSEATTNDLRGAIWDLRRGDKAKIPSDTDGLVVRRGGGYGQGPIMAYAFRPEFFSLMSAVKGAVQGDDGPKTV